MSDADPGEAVEDGERVGRYLVVRDNEGRLNAVAANAVSALQQLEDGTTLLMLTGGRMMVVPHPLGRVLAWCDGRR